MKPDDFMNSKMMDEMYGDRHIDDSDPADGVIFSCAVGFWLWFIGYFIWTWVLA